MSSTTLQYSQPKQSDSFALRVQTSPQPSLTLPLNMQATSNPTIRAPSSTSPPTSSAPSRPPSISPTSLLSQFAVTPQPKPLSPYTRLSLSTSHSPRDSPFSSLNPYFLPPISPSNYCKSPSLLQRSEGDWSYCLSPSQKRDSPRMGAKEANELWETQWSPFGGAARGAAGAGAAKVKSPNGGKFSWQWEENGHERDKGDDSTSEEEDDEEQKEERKEQDTTLDAAQGRKKTTSFAFDNFEPAFAPVAPTSATSTSIAAKYAMPAISPRTFKATLTPKQNRLSASSSGTSSPAIVPVPVPSTTTFSLYPASAHPGSPPPPSPVLASRPSGAVTPIDPVSSTKAPPAMATAAAATLATTGPTPAALAAAALLKANTTHNKTIAATPEELFADLDTPAHGLSARTRKQKAKSVVFCDEAPGAAGGGGGVGRALAEVHIVPDDYTQYPIPSKKKKGKGKEKCRVM